MKEKVPLENRRIGSGRADIAFTTSIQTFFFYGLHMMASALDEIAPTPDFGCIGFQKPPFGRI